MKKKIVAIGGGSGLAVLLKGLKKYPCDLSAIVTMTDNGTSTGRLRKQFNILPPGDIRKIIAVLAKDEKTWTELFNYRFRRGKGLAGHTLGNLFILALEKITGNFREAVVKTSEILNINGKVIPSTLESIDLVARLKNGKIIKGERKAYLAGRKNPIDKIWLDKKNIQPNPDAIYAIQNADVILIGPGSLWTSILPNFLINNITKSIIENKKAKKIYICNVSTERGETQNYSVDDHIMGLVKSTNKKIFNQVIVNNKIIKTSEKSHILGEIHNITTNQKIINNYQIIIGDVINQDNPLFHDSTKLAKIIWKSI